MLKFISAVIIAAASAGVLTLLSATSTRLDAGPARDAAPQSSPFTQTTPTLAATAISPELVRLEVARDLAAMRDSIDQLAAKQEQMAQTIATLQAAEQDIIQTRSSAPVSGPVSPPPRKKARRVGKLATQSSSVPTPAFLPQ
jgi:multidrug resistance efflux pump